MRRLLPLAVLLVLGLGLSAAPRHLVSQPAASPSFVHFESGQVHPLAMTPNGNTLVVVNTPDNRLSVFSLTDSVPMRVAEIPVGMEPVSVRALNDSIVWVVNQISDDVSIVNLNLAHTVNTLRVGDSPGDVVFANGKAYVSVMEEDAVKVYDPTTLAQLGTISVPGRMPRSLARDAAGGKVYVACLLDGNRTAILAASKIPQDSFPEDYDLPTDPGLPTPPKTGLIVQLTGANWYDMYGNLWNSKIKFTMPDPDVSEIETVNNTITRSFPGLGSAVYDVAVSPTDGRLAVPANEARNIQRFEPRVTGYLAETNLTFVTQAGVQSQRKLDPHIDYETVPGTQAEADSAIGTPTGAAYAAAGNRLYVTSLATNKIAVVDPNGGSLSSVKARVSTIEGPTGVLVDDARSRLYVVGRFRNQLATVSTASMHAVAITQIGMDPTPNAIVHGRQIFYAGMTSTHGDQSCATCHVFGDLDNLAWDLGDPNGGFVPPPSPNPLGLTGFHPMKGPMTTQTLHGMTNTEPFHWRGDRLNLSAFNGAFVTLMGRTDPLPDSQMTAFSDFVMPLTMPPNPHLNLDRSFPDAVAPAASPLRGREMFLDSLLFENSRTCVSCHDEANNGPGTNRQMVAQATIFETQDLKVPQLRNVYRKGGLHDVTGGVSKRGFGYSHDGSADTPYHFLQRPQFTFSTDSATADQQRRDMESYLIAFDTGMSPAVGYQITFTGANNNDATTLATLDTLRGDQSRSDCDLIAKGRVGGVARGWVYMGGAGWMSDKSTEPLLSTSQLIALAGAGSEVTITGVPRGSGTRMGIDRDEDGFRDTDEILAGSDPANAASTPGTAGVPPAAGAAFALRAVGPNPFHDFTEVSFTLGRAATVDMAVYDVLGREVRAVAHGERFAAGVATLRWDGRDRSGAATAAGVYFVRVRIPEAGIQWTRPVVRIR